MSQRVCAVAFGAPWRSVARVGPALALIIATGSLVGCAKMTAIDVTDTNSATGSDISCQAFEPIRWSKADTDETILAAKTHNTVWLSLCGANQVPAAE
ncbi:MAG: hypothetical protein AAFO77_06105 [Pseudomonadota bacterium]